MHTKTAGKQEQARDSTKTPPGVKKKRAVRLKKMTDIRRFGSRIINEFYQGKLDESEARTLGYLLATLGTIIKNDVEDRLEKVEMQTQEQRKYR